MIEFTPEILLDIVVIVLLVPTLFYAVILNNRLTALRKSRDELAKVVNSFNEATMRAEAGIPRLKRATSEANTTLQERMEKAQSLRDDLAFMIQRSEEMAERLDGRLKSSRVDAPPQPAPPSQPQAPQPAAYAGVEPRLPGRPVAPQPARQTDASIESDLQGALAAARKEAQSMGNPSGATLADRAMQADQPASAAPVAPAKDSVVEEERSQAERELLKALQSAR